LCLFCGLPQAFAAAPDLATLEKNIATANREISRTEKELSSLKKQQARLKKQGVPKNKHLAKQPDTSALTDNIADYTHNLSVLQQQLDAAFLALSDAPVRQSVNAESSALLDDPDMVIAAAREEWLAHTIATQAVAAIRSESGHLDKTRQQRQQVEKDHQKQAHAAQEHRQHLDNLRHQITVTQSLLAEQRQQLRIQRDTLQQEQQRLAAARKPVRKPAAKPVTVAAVQHPLLQPAALHTPAVKYVPPGRFPVNGKVVMKFGDKDALGVKSSGIVLEAAEGENIVLPQEGIIKFAGAFGKFKQLLIVEHKGGYHSLISGLGEVETKIGEHLPAGAVIGHLAQAQAYYELRHNGVPVDPDKVSMPF